MLLTLFKTKYINKFLAKILVFFLFFIIGITLHTQSVFAELKNNEIIATINPQIPVAFQDVRIDLKSYLIDIDKAKITWIVNGKTQLDGLGKKVFTVKTGEIGSITNIEIKISINGASVTKAIFLSPAEMDVLWEGINTYVPPFYKGKAIPAPEAQIKFTAIPNMKNASGQNIKGSELTYSWKKNYNGDQEASGYGKDGYTAKNSYFDEIDNVEVFGSSMDGITARGKAMVVYVTPRIIFYPATQSGGIEYNKTVTNGYKITNSDFQIYAIPFGFSFLNPKDSNLTYSWSLNNKLINTPVEKNMLALKIDPNQKGEAIISLSLESFSRLLQTAKNTVRVDIGK